MTFHHERRLDRAIHHLESFRAELTAWREEGSHRTWTELDAQSGKKLIWAQVLKPPPLSLTLIAGDCIHNLCASLDNLAFELALARAKGPLSRGVERDSGFPIYHRDPAMSSDRRSSRKFANMIQGIDKRAQTIIKELQPYNRGDEFRRDRLWQLNELENIDKHRLPPATTLVTLSALSFFDLEGIGTNEVEILLRFFDESAPIARYPAVDSTGAEVNMDFTATFDVCFSHGVPDGLIGESIPRILDGFHRHIVNRVLTPLRGFLTGH